MPDVTPYTKESQLARGPKKYRRKIASSKQWEAIFAAKVTGARCRVCDDPEMPGHGLQGHHVVPRGAPWFGDDTEDNIVPLGHGCHDKVTRRAPEACRLLLSSLTDAEYSYALERGGEAFFERYYLLVYEPEARPA